MGDVERMKVRARKVFKSVEAKKYAAEVSDDFATIMDTCVEAIANVSMDTCWDEFECKNDIGVEFPVYDVWWSVEKKPSPFQYMYGLFHRFSADDDGKSEACETHSLATAGSEDATFQACKWQKKNGSGSV